MSKKSSAPPLEKQKPQRRRAVFLAWALVFFILLLYVLTIYRISASIALA